MNSPSAPALPPYSPPPSSTAAPSSSALSSSHPNSNPPTQRKTVRFEADEALRRKLGPASAAPVPTINRVHRAQGGPLFPNIGSSTSSTSSSPLSSGRLGGPGGPGNVPYFSFGNIGSNDSSNANISNNSSNSSSNNSSNISSNNSNNSNNANSANAADSNSNANTIPNVTPGSGPPSYDGDDTDHIDANSKDDEKVVRASLLQPRVAVVLGLPRLWHLPLFACRLLSVCPAIWWSLGIFIRLLTQLHALALARSGFGGARPSSNSGGVVSGGLGIYDRGSGLSLESRLKLTETALAMIWCGASAYLSFFFTDCLMSRWLLNYTPQATIVRLLAINALNGYLTSWVIYLMGSGGDSRLLLPAWVAIAAILTGLYHGTQRKINIRKETSISISVFSFASFISMAALLAQLYWDRPEYVDVPVVALARRVCTETARVAGNIFDIGNITMDL